MIVLLERTLQTAVEIGASCGPFGIAAFAIIAVILILGFVISNKKIFSIQTLLTGNENSIQ